MRDVSIALLFLALILLVPYLAGADDVVEEPGKFVLTWPQETNATAFLFLDSWNLAGGIAHTFVRLEHTSIDWASLDGDITTAGTIIEGEGNNDQYIYGGLGAKINFYLLGKKENDPGIHLVPNIGATVMNNWAESRMPKDVLTNLKWAIYGTLLQYKWF